MPEYQVCAVWGQMCIRDRGNITGICLQKTASATGMNAQDRICSPVSPAVPAGSLATPVVPSTASAPEAVPTTDKPAGSSKAIPLNSFRTQRELKNLYIIAEQYLGKTLTATEIETITCLLYTSFPLMILPLPTRQFFTTAPGLYFAGGRSLTLENTSGYSLKK